jgi:hypothetical protein
LQWIRGGGLVVAALGHGRVPFGRGERAGRIGRIGGLGRPRCRGTRGAAPFLEAGLWCLCGSDIRRLILYHDWVSETAVTRHDDNNQDNWLQ